MGKRLVPWGTIALCVLVVLLPRPADGFAASKTKRWIDSWMLIGVNFIRAEHGLKPLKLDNKLARSCRRAVQRIAYTSELRHAEPSTRGFAQQREALGYGLRGGDAIGEVLGLWLASPAHRKVVFSRHPVGGSAFQLGVFRGHNGVAWCLRTGKPKKKQR